MYACDALPPALVAVTENANVPTAVGVPVTVQLLFTVSPVGTEPPAEHVGPFVAPMVCEYAILRIPPGSVAVVIVGGAVTTVMLSA